MREVDAFFATLAQTTAAFLGILAASVAAFYIFFKTRRPSTISAVKKHRCRFVRR
jgi:hypothetical protein